MDYTGFPILGTSSASGVQAGPGPYVSHDFPMYADTSGLVIIDSGINPASLIGGPFLRLDGSSTMTGTINSLDVIPTVDNASDLGSASKRLKTMYGYVLTGPTNTRNVDDIISAATATSTTSNLAGYSDSSGLKLYDTGISAASVTGPFLKLDGTSAMTGDINANSHEVKGVTAIRTASNIILVGNTATGTTAYDIVIGDASSSAGTGTNIVLGSLSGANGFKSTALGHTAHANGLQSTSVGYGASNSVNDQGTSIGSLAQATGSGASSLGYNARATGTSGLAFGYSSNSTGAGSLSLGGNSAASAAGAIALGLNCSSTAIDAFCLGDALTNGTAHSTMIGDSAHVNIRAANTTTDLGTTGVPFQTLYLNGSITGPTQTRLANDLVSNTGSAAAGNIANFVSSKVIQDSGVPSSALSGAPFLPLSGGVMSGDLDINGHVINNVLAGNVRIGYTTTASYTDSVIIGNFAGSSGVGSVIAIGPNTTGANTAIGIGSGVTAGSGSTVIGEGSVDLGTINTLYGRGQTTAAANTGVVSFGDVNAATVDHAMMFGDHLTNSTANSLLLGNSSLVNIRTPSTVCDLGTAAVPFQTLYTQKVIASSGACFSGYTSGGFSVGFTAATPKLVVTGTLTELNDPLGQFTPTASTGRVEYTGATTRYFNVRILFNILGNASANTYTAWVAKNGSTTSVAPRNFNFTTATPVGYLPFEVSNIYQLAQNDNVQLAAQYTATANVNIFDIQVIITPIS